MTIKQLSVALPITQNIGWGLAGRRITEELKKLALCSDLNGTGLLESPYPVDLQGNLLQAINGVQCQPQYGHLATHSTHAGYCFIENNLQLPNFVQNLNRAFDVVITGSTWGSTEIASTRETGLPELKVAIQGVDSDLFCPAPYATWTTEWKGNEKADRITLGRQTDPAWFTVFSGGKWEFRKGQDIVLAAMKVMMERYKDVRLLANWWNPWPETARTMEASKLVDYRQSACDYTGSIVRCAEPILGRHNGDRVEFHWQMLHHELPSLLRRADVALFPSRCEAGTNLPLMEAAACGVPIIAPHGHGHRDVRSAIAFWVECETFTYAQDGVPIGRWFEPKLDQVITHLETAYNLWRSKELRSVYGTQARKNILPFTWKACAESILEAF